MIGLIYYLNVEQKTKRIRRVYDNRCTEMMENAPENDLANQLITSGVRHNVEEETPLQFLECLICDGLQLTLKALFILN